MRVKVEVYDIKTSRQIVTLTTLFIPRVGEYISIPHLGERWKIVELYWTFGKGDGDHYIVCFAEERSKEK